MPVDWLSIAADNCSIRRALDLVGEKWTLLVIRDAMNGVSRFEDFHRHVGLSEPVLANRLKKLVAAEIFEPRAYRIEGHRTRTEYRLTEKGWELRPAIVGLMQWGDRYLADPEGPPIRLRHADCGATVRANIVCTREQSAVTAAATLVERGPSAKATSARRRRSRAGPA